MIIIDKDITTVERGLVAHGVNCQGKMGSGVAKAIRAKWPLAYTKYMKVIDMAGKGKHLLGRVQITDIENDLCVLNCFTQENYGYGGETYADKDAVIKAFRRISYLADSMRLPAYAPRIGCGLGGLNWDDIYPEIKDLNITICDWS